LTSCTTTTTTSTSELSSIPSASHARTTLISSAGTNTLTQPKPVSDLRLYDTALINRRHSLQPTESDWYLDVFDVVYLSALQAAATS
jgi:hypothetical protein